jgi:hypothetical protein
MVMVENNLNRKENIKRANDFVKSIKTYPIELIDLQFEFDAFDSFFDSITDKELSMLLDRTLLTARKIFGKKIKIAVYPLLAWEENEMVHRITVKFILVGKSLENRIENFQENLNEFKDEVWGGQLKLRYIKENSMEDVFIEVFPVQFDTYLFDYNIFTYGNHFLKFYSRDLFRFLTSPMEIY